MRSCRRFYDCWGRSTKNTIHDGGHAECAFIITFAVTPRNPEPGAYSRLVVTVRDPETLRLVADEGYNGIYGSAREKSIKLYSPGRYIVTLDGRFVDVTVKMATEQANCCVTSPGLEKGEWRDGEQNEWEEEFTEGMW